MKKQKKYIFCFFIICRLKCFSHFCSSYFQTIKNNIMGRGDKKSKKGKIFKGSFGKSRPAKVVKSKKADEKKDS
jgi:30S ribosomal protein S31